MFFFYVLKSLQDGKLYKGVTENLEKRLQAHNSGKVSSTRNRRPFALIYTENFGTRAEALKKEKYYKSYSGGVRLKKILESL